jgi:hypothetical protein
MGATTIGMKSSSAGGVVVLRMLCLFLGRTTRAFLPLRAFPRSVRTTRCLIPHAALRMASTPGDTPAALLADGGDVQFGKFVIPQASVFYRGKQSYAFVNLRPIVPGHVLVMSAAVVPTMAELSEEAYLDLWLTVRTIQACLSKEYVGVTAFNVAVQDGRAAGQSVAHV